MGLQPGLAVVPTLGGAPLANPTLGGAPLTNPPPGAEVPAPAPKYTPEVITVSDHTSPPAVLEAFKWRSSPRALTRPSIS